jgi:Holliday junction resolvase RusA-like endonuclease
MRAQRSETFRGDVAVSIEFDIDPARDLDSAISATFDALEDAGVVTNDRQVAVLHVVRRRHPRGQADSVRVTAEPCS